MMTDEQLGFVRDKIKHIFVLMLENRSFDHIFGKSGIPGITTATAANYNEFNGERYPFTGGASDPMPSDPGHEFSDVVEQLTGNADSYTKGSPYPSDRTMSGFVQNYATTTTEGPVPAGGKVGCVMQAIDMSTQSPTLYKLAKQFVVCDHWHSSLPGPTWPNRYFLHGATSSGLDDSPTKAEIAKWEAEIGSGFEYVNGSIFDRLQKPNYRLYHDESGPLLGQMPQVTSIKGISFFDIEDVSTLATDLQGDYPYQYTFIEPSYGDVINETYQRGSSQHPMDGLAAGDKLVATVYDAIRNSPLWNNSLLIITYDEHGGFYDSVIPGNATPPGDGGIEGYSMNGFDFSVYGVRVPAVIVSPWVQEGGVDHTLYDHTSVLATLERLFKLEPLTDRDKNANDLLSLIQSTCRDIADEDN